MIPYITPLRSSDSSSYGTGLGPTCLLIYYIHTVDPWGQTLQVALDHLRAALPAMQVLWHMPWHKFSKAPCSGFKCRSNPRCIDQSCRMEDSYMVPTPLQRSAFTRNFAGNPGSHTWEDPQTCPLTSGPTLNEQRFKTLIVIKMGNLET